MDRALCIVIALWCAASAPAHVQNPLPSSQAAAEWLRKAETWLGGRDQLARVRALEVGRGETETIRILLPDKYHIETIAPFGKTTIAFDGSTIWRTSDLRALNQAPADDVAPDVLRRRGLARLTEMTVTYLARPANDTVTARVHDGECGVIDGVCIAFDAGTSFPVLLVLGRDDGRPLAVVTRSANQEYVNELADYRTVSGVKFPFKVVTRRRALPDGQMEAVGTLTYRSYVVNPQLRAQDFVKPSRQ